MEIVHFYFIRKSKFFYVRFTYGFCISLIYFLVTLTCGRCFLFKYFCSISSNGVKSKFFGFERIYCEHFLVHGIMRNQHYVLIIFCSRNVM